MFPHKHKRPKMPRLLPASPSVAMLKFKEEKKSNSILEKHPDTQG
jgi:hypothetical protein